jgi:hypothetical protein
MANPGLVFDFQLIDVGNFNGVGESEPNPFFYQVNRVLTQVILGKTLYFDCLILITES